MNIDLELVSETAKIKIFRGIDSVVPYIRRFFRFLALPYCFAKVNWTECNKSKVRVAFDFLYIFFKLKYYPDNYSSCRFWEKSRSVWVFYYGSNYDPFQRSKLQRRVQPKKYEIVFQDKVITEMICRANRIPTPKIERVVNAGELLVSVTRELGSSGSLYKFIFKPRDGKAGHGITYCELNNDKIVAIQSGRFVEARNLVAKEQLVVQQYISQHKDLSCIAESTNTIRLVSLLKKDGSVVILGAYARFGVGNNKVDNMNQGGICVPIDSATGFLGKIGFDKLGRILKEHPTSGVIFDGFKIPMWNDVINLSKSVQSAFFFYPLLGVDIAICNSGPIVIEINSNYDNVGLERTCGPILRKKEVYEAFREYDLLINKQQQTLSKVVNDEK